MWSNRRKRPLDERLQDRFERWPWWAMVPVSFGTFVLVGYGGAAVFGWQRWWFTTAVGFFLAWSVTAIGFNALASLRGRRLLLTNQGSLDGFGRISWRQFEQLIVAWYEREQFVVEKRGGLRRDGGIDLIARKTGLTHIVQCKHWKVDEVQVDEVQRMAGIVQGWKRKHPGDVRGVVVCSWLFSADAIDFAKDVDVELVNGDDLVRRLQSIAVGRYVEEVDPPTCELCSHRMVRRTNPRGNPFWGCSHFARTGCGFTIDIEAAIPPRRRVA